jgi:hypothetical protein
MMLSCENCGPRLLAGRGAWAPCQRWPEQRVPDGRIACGRKRHNYAMLQHHFRMIFPTAACPRMFRTGELLPALSVGALVAGSILGPHEPCRYVIPANT